MSDGDPQATELVAEAVYSELRRLARGALAREHRNHSLQPTALVNEAFVRLLQGEAVDWQDRQHFFFLAARMMRRIVIEYFRHKDTGKSIKPELQRPLDEAVVFTEDRAEEALIVNEALDRLADFDARASRVVELKYFGGLTNEQVADVLNVSAKTVVRDWNAARDWLRGHYGLARGSAQ
jgi:RNA polymerase sigma factor (TIGR02999 family)